MMQSLFAWLISELLTAYRGSSEKLKVVFARNSELSFSLPA
jgi:hypothetical protein